ncbi:transcription elongation factor GreAB [Rhodopirellula sp. SM50]|nr:GreA/GreB family elongation factor [Rhodopirellula sp. SM50]PAY16142.1 transcription elongation factor GreAB [Rhodopirellula sp. SM50]
MACPRKLVTHRDFRHLVELLKDELLGAMVDPKAFRELAGELQHATIVDAVSVPPDVVTMNSTVKLRDLESDSTETYTLVYPEDANIAEGRLSILAPIGIAIFGDRVGNRVRWAVPAGKRNMRIDDVIYQPERDAVSA